ncbi:RsfS/YbeB/iojap family protein [Candidatus Villigracilis saccharophilus]|uniref:RsfS/YbeB/iojap family protein n=1 Tax=Candidatus Villigracilis saccharophilus TaxID=3140684 RepID=UPI003134F34E|nr:RsfS/YbeB/iojap family protein [Anaerolineales bacterium]
MKDIVSFTDYFIICTGTSDRMLDALAKATVEDIRSKYKKKENNKVSHAMAG